MTSDVQLDSLRIARRGGGPLEIIPERTATVGG
jgi:hypothetical protein